MAKNKSTPVIKLKSLTKRYGIGDAEQIALDDIDLTINKGEFIAIMGPSGCGKTTLLNILGLLDKPDEGTYHLDKKVVTNLSGAKCAKIRNEKIGFVFQSFNLIPRLNVVENVALPLTYTGKSRVKSLKIASETLQKFHLNEREYYMPYQLSGGQTQRVAIARALVNRPSIILADEPTGNLDSKASHIIMEELSEIHKRGNTIVMVTHNPDMTTYADRIITMIDGRIDTDTKDIKSEADEEKMLHKKTLPSKSTKPKVTGSDKKDGEKSNEKPDKSLTKPATVPVPVPKPIVKTESNKTEAGEKPTQKTEQPAKATKTATTKVENPASQIVKSTKASKATPEPKNPDHDTAETKKSTTVHHTTRTSKTKTETKTKSHDDHTKTKKSSTKTDHPKVEPKTNAHTNHTIQQSKGQK